MNDHMQALRIGKISSVNYQKGTARVTYEDRDDSVTSELPFLAWTYWMPTIEDRVLVGHLSGGAAVIIGPTWHDGNRPADYGADLYRQEMSAIQGQAFFSYSSRTGVYTIHAEHIEFISYGDEADITVAALISRIRSLESRCASLEQSLHADETGGDDS